MIPNYRTLPQKVLDTLLRIQPDILNISGESIAVLSNAVPLDIQLKQLVSRINTEAIDELTGRVNYTRLKNSEIYHEYQQLTQHLALFDLSTLVQHERKLAFWLNLYNVLVIDGIIHYGIRKTVAEMLGFFRQTAYCIDGYRFCLDDIENGILRANAGHPFIPGPQFGKNDPGLNFALDKTDYRIHFALVCGAVSCPPINFYDAENIDVQLNLAAQNFLEQNLELDAQTSSIKLSKILQWYPEDFGASSWVKFGIGDKTPLLRAIKPYIVDDKKCAIIEKTTKHTKIEFKSYNWALNSI